MIWKISSCITVMVVVCLFSSVVNIDEKNELLFGDWVDTVGLNCISKLSISNDYTLQYYGCELKDSFIGNIKIVNGYVYAYFNINVYYEHPDASIGPFALKGMLNRKKNKLIFTEHHKKERGIYRKYSNIYVKYIKIH